VPAKEGGHYDRPPQARNSGGQADKAVPCQRTVRALKALVAQHGNANGDKKYQQQQEKLYQKQEQEHVKMQQKQEQDHRDWSNSKRMTPKCSKWSASTSSRHNRWRKTRAAATAHPTTATAAPAASSGGAPESAQGKTVAGGAVNLRLTQ